MKQEILNRLQALGGDISKVKGNSLQEDLLAITFNTVLYEKPQDNYEIGRASCRERV